MEDISNIQRILLNMKYDSKKTLTENYNKVLLNEDAQMAESGIEKYWNAFNSRLQTAGYPTKRIGENQSWVGSFIFYKVGDALATITLKNGKVCSFKQNKEYAGQTLDLVMGYDNCKTSNQSNLLGWLGYYTVQTGYKTPAAAPAAAAASDSNKAKIEGSIFGTGDKWNQELWEKFKSKANEFLAGCKEYTDSKFSNDKRAKYLSCSNGMGLYAYETTGDEAVAKLNNKKWFSTFSYGGESFDNYVGKDETGASMSLGTFIRTTSYGKPSTGGGGTKPGAVIGAQVGSTAPKVEAKPCSGTFKQGCKDGGGDTTIAKVQKCLLDKGMYKTSSGKPARVDGDFGSGTLAGIKQLLGKDTFTAEEVDTKICGPGAQTPPGVSSGGGGQDTGTQTSDDRETVGGQ